MLMKDCNFRDLSWALPQYQMIDLTKDYGRGCEALLRIWKNRPRK